MPPNIFHGSCWDTIWIPTDHMDLFQTDCKQVPDFSRAQGREGGGNGGMEQMNLVFYFATLYALVTTNITYQHLSTVIVARG